MDTRTFSLGDDTGTGPDDGPDDVHVNFPLALVLDDELPRPAYISRQPVSYLYFLLLVDRQRMNELAPPLRRDLQRYLYRVVKKVDALNVEASATARDILYRGAGMQPRPIGDWSAFSRNARREEPSTAVDRALLPVIERVRDEDC